MIDAEIPTTLKTALTKFVLKKALSARLVAAFPS